MKGIAKAGEEMDSISGILALALRTRLQKKAWKKEKLEEIRLRIGKPVWILYAGKGMYLSERGGFTEDLQEAYWVTEEDLRETLSYASNYSLYAMEEQLRQGYFTIAGGHRIGVAGRIVMEHGKWKQIAHIAMMNIRIAHEVIGCARQLMPYLKKRQWCSTLLISPPGGGKTTLLRDCIRILASEEEKMTVGVVDERSEIAACKNGVPQNQLGITVDVLDGCSKEIGMLHLLRAMAPDVIAVDEIGTLSDQEVILQVNHCGCILFATMHGTCMQELKRKKWMEDLLQERVFERYVFLDHHFHVGNIKEIYDENGKRIFCEKEERMLYVTDYR